MLGGTNAVCITALGGPLGRVIAGQMEEFRIPTRSVSIAGESRINTAVMHDYPGRRDVEMINEDGPPMDETEVDRLKETIDETVMESDILVISGSALPGVSPEDLRDIASRARARGARLAVDIAGKWLQALVREQLWVLKINQEELAQAFDMDGEDVASLDRFRRDHGIGELVITRGKRGAFALADGTALETVPPSLEVNFAVGSGDAFFAGLLYGRARDLSLRESLVHATACGAANALTVGAARMSYDDYARFLEQSEVREV
jgi:1-phosphofructokinase family hexose kinase